MKFDELKTFLVWFFFEPFESFFTIGIKKIWKDLQKPRFYIQIFLLVALIQLYLKRYFSAFLVILIIGGFIMVNEWKNRRWVGWARRKRRERLKRELEVRRKEEKKNIYTEVSKSL